MKIAALSVLAASVVGMQAAPFVLDFEGIGDGVPVGNYYNGGGGPDYNIDFSPATLALIDSDAGGGGNFANEPTPSTIMFFLDSNNAILNANDGFTDGFSFYYSSSVTTTVTVYDALNGTGNVLGTINLPANSFGAAGGDPNGYFDVWSPVGVAFAGTAYSIDFGGTANQTGFDNVTFGDDDPIENPVPEPSTVIGGLALGALVARRALRRK